MAIHDLFPKAAAPTGASVYHQAMQELIDTLGTRVYSYEDQSRVPDVYRALMAIVATADVYGIRTADAAVAVNERLTGDAAAFSLFEEIMIEWGVRLDSLGLRAPVIALVAKTLTLTAPESEVSTTTDYRASRRVVGHERWLVSLWIPLLFFLRNNLGIMAQAFEAKK